MLHRLQQALQQQQQQQLQRLRRVRHSPQGNEVLMDDSTMLSFCSNDYLGLAADKRVTRALRRGAEQYGVGSGASHLISGHCQSHHLLEQELAEFVGSERALLFSTGYMANLGIVSSLVDRHATVYEDKLNHASLIDAARLSQARVKRYRHRHYAQLEQQLSGVDGDKLISSDAVFSMDGDQADLQTLSNLAIDHQAWLLIDDAHGFGVLGEGRGSLAQAKVPVCENTILMGTLGKALGCFGAFVAGSEAVIETLMQQARTYIYTTALPPALAEATRESLRLLQHEPWRRQQLQQLITSFRQQAAELGLPLMDSNTAIQPLMLASSKNALAVSRALQAEGILVPAIRPPTVPQGSARLRITFSATHSEAQLTRLLDALSRAIKAEP